MIEKETTEGNNDRKLVSWDVVVALCCMMEWQVHLEGLYHILIPRTLVTEPNTRLHDARRWPAIPRST